MGVDKLDIPRADDLLIIINNPFEKVLEDLSATERTFLGKKVLSLGEGLSNFTTKLSVIGVDTTAVDLIYQLGNTVLSENYPSSAVTISNQRVKFIYRQQLGENYTPPDKRSVKLVAGDTYSLPFENGKFDSVVANRLFEYIDLSLALPELLRVVNHDDGEIRLGGAVLHCNPRKNILFGGVYERTDYNQVVLRESTSFITAFENLGDNNTEVSVYVVVGEPATKSAVRDQTNAHTVKTLIFSFDTNPPVIESDDYVTPNNGHGAYYNKIYKVDPRKMEMSEVQQY